jgi:putative membrane fusion protein
MGMLERTYIAEHGKIDVADEVSAFIVRDEKVYVSAQKSKINRLAESDRLVKAGTKVVELTPTENPEPEEEEEAEAADAKKDDKTAADNKDSKKSEKDTVKTEDELDSSHENLGRYTTIINELGDSVAVTADGTTRTAGYVSYSVDGVEAKLSTKAIESLNYDDLKSLTRKRSVKVPSRSCGENYPVFKVVRNRKWYLVYYLDKEAAAKYAAGDTVTIEVNDEDVPVTVRTVTEEGKKTKIILTCKTFFDGFLEERSLDTKVTVVSAEGLVLEDGSIVEAPDGRRGVFVKNKLGEHVFTPIRTKADDGTKCVVYSDIYVDENGNYVETIGTYDEIIAEPSEDDIATLKKSGSGKKS